MCADQLTDNSRGSVKTHFNVGPVFPRFVSRNVDDGSLARVIDDARLVPAEMNVQAWRWIVVRNDAAKKYLESATSIRVPLSSAPVILICLADTLAWKSAPQYLKEMINNKKITAEEGFEALRRLRDYYSSSPEIARRTALANAFVAVHQVLLGAAATKLSSYLVTEFDEAKIKNHFHIPDSFLVAALVPLGYDDDVQVASPSAVPHRSYVYLEKFGEALSDGRS